jgi:elongation factor Ts
MGIEVSVGDIKKLRQKTGAGIMNCKQSLLQNQGNFEKALEDLKIKGFAVALKKSMRNVQEGMISSYIHTGNKLGILVEVNCETDFVARQLKFQEFAKNVAMQIASSPDVIVISFDELPLDVKMNEWKIEERKKDLLNKPENIKTKIIEGRVNKTLKSKVLLEQPYIRDPNITINELLKEHIAFFDENIKIARFSRYYLAL